MVTMFIGGVPGEVLPILTLMDPSAKWTRETPRLMLFRPKNIGNARDDLLDYPQEKYEENVCY